LTFEQYNELVTLGIKSRSRISPPAIIKDTTRLDKEMKTYYQSFIKDKPEHKRFQAAYNLGNTLVFLLNQPDLMSENQQAQILGITVKHFRRLTQQILNLCEFGDIIGEEAIASVKHIRVEMFKKVDISRALIRLINNARNGDIEPIPLA
jgi:hypothetical protein